MNDSKQRIGGRGERRDARNVDPGCFDQWAPRLIVFLTWAVPLVLCLDMDDTFDLPKLTLVYSVDLALLALWVWQMLDRGVLQIRRTILDFPLLFFFLAAGLSTFFSIDPRLSVLGAYKIYVFGWLPMLAFAALYWFTAQVASAALLGRVQAAAVGSAAVVSIYGVLQYTGHEIFERMPIAAGGRVWSSLGNPLYMGAVCMMAVPLALSRFITPNTIPHSAPSPSEGRGNLKVPLPSGERPGEGWFGLLVILLLLVGLALSLSRSAWLGALAGAGGVLYVCRGVWKRNVFIGGALITGVVLMTFIPGVRERASVLFSTREGSNAARLAGWKAGLKVWRDHPILGAGPDTFFEAFRPYRNMDYVRAAGASVTQADAHNDFIQIAATQGTIGLVAFVWVLVTFFRMGGSLTEPARRIGLFSLCAALGALLVQDQFNFSTVTTSAWAAVFAGLLSSTPSPPAREGDASIPHPLSPVSRGWLMVLLVLCPVGWWAVSLPVRADLAFKEGEIQAQRGQYFNALAFYQKAMDLQGGIETYQTELANTFRTLGRLSSEGSGRERYFDRAWAVAEGEVTQHPHNPDAWNNRGVVAMWLVQLAHRDMQREAKQSFEHAVFLDPVFVDAWANLAKWEHLAGHLDAEKNLWRKVLEIDPRHPMALQVLGLRIIEP